MSGYTEQYYSSSSQYKQKNQNRAVLDFNSTSLSRCETQTLPTVYEEHGTSHRHNMTAPTEQWSHTLPAPTRHGTTPGSQHTRRRVTSPTMGTQTLRNGHQHHLPPLKLGLLQTSSASKGRSQSEICLLLPSNRMIAVNDAQNGQTQRTVNSDHILPNTSHVDWYGPPTVSQERPPKITQHRQPTAARHGVRLKYSTNTLPSRLKRDHVPRAQSLQALPTSVDKSNTVNSDNTSSCLSGQKVVRPDRRKTSRKKVLHYYTLSIVHIVNLNPCFGRGGWLLSLSLGLSLLVLARLIFYVAWPLSPGVLLAI